MAIRNDDRQEINLHNMIEFDTRYDIRQFLLQTWSIETPQTRYRYFVENLINGSRIYLQRPGNLNKGCDFVIFVENLITYQNGYDRPPKFVDILRDLADKARINHDGFIELRNLIRRVYECEQLTMFLGEANTIIWADGWNSELILKLLKWFFIEQDITYWNGQGRNMLWTRIQEI